MLPEILARLKSLATRFVDADVGLGIVMHNFQVSIHIVRPR